MIHKHKLQYLSQTKNRYNIICCANTLGTQVFDCTMSLASGTTSQGRLICTTKQHLATTTFALISVVLSMHVTASHANKLVHAHTHAHVHTPVSVHACKFERESGAVTVTMPMPMPMPAAQQPPAQSAPLPPSSAIMFVDCMVPEKTLHNRSTIIDTIRIARLFNPHTTIFLMTAARSRMELEVLCLWRVKLRDCSAYNNTEEEGRFKQIYRHSSVNIYAKELFCFTRFMMVKKLVHDEALKQILFADADMMLTSNIFVELALNGSSHLRTIFRSTTYLSMWKTEGLDAFVEYMVFFYSRPMAEIEKDILKFGSRSHTSTAPGFITQFSDMSLLRIFQERTRLPITIDFLNIPAVIQSKQLEYSTIISMRVAFRNPKICYVKVPELFVDTNFVWRPIDVGGMNVSIPCTKQSAVMPVSGGGGGTGGGTGGDTGGDTTTTATVSANVDGRRPLIAVHFQGVACKSLMHAFAKKIVPLVTQIEHGGYRRVHA